MYIIYYMETARAFPTTQLVKNLPAMQETQVQCLGQEDPLEMGMATPSSILAVNQNLGLSCLENYMDRGAWQTTVHGVSKIQKQLSN